MLFRSGRISIETGKKWRRCAQCIYNQYCQSDPDDSVQFIGTNSDSKLIDIGSLWDSVGEIKKNPEKTKKVEKMERMRKDWDLISDQIEMLKQKPEEQLTEEERKILEENDRNNSIMEKVFYYG